MVVIFGLLAELHDLGVLSDSAYDAAKRRIINQE